MLVVVDYFSNYFEVARLHSTPSTAVIKELKVMFARFGIPVEIVSDNGPQFASSEFSCFAQEWGFKHQTTSPYHPQANGKAEQAVQTVKRLFQKCKETGQSEFLALLDWRNTPSEGIGVSPAQRLLGRRCQTLMPTTATLLQPRFPIDGDKEALLDQKRRQKSYFDRSAKSLPSLETGDTVQIRLPGKEEWSQGVCVKVHGCRRYSVKVNGKRYRRNRRQIIRVSGQEDENLVVERQSPSVPDSSPEEEEKEEETTGQEWMEREGEGSAKVLPESDAQEEGQSVRRSSRSRQRPRWLDDFQT